MGRNNILTKIKNKRPAAVPLPDVPDFIYPEINTIEEYKSSAQKNGINILHINGGWPAVNVHALFPDCGKTVDLTGPSPTLPNRFDDIGLLILNGQMGVAENGAIWVDENNFPKRVLPFITQQLLFVLNKKNIVQNMHEAYQKIKIDGTGFGVFIAGPSKTADIEQSLVIGAQGAREMFVVLV